MSQTTTPAPQPSAALDQVIATILSTVSMAVSALHLVPGMPVQVLAIVQTAIGDLQAAYTAYRANPTASLFDQISTILTTALADVKAVVHP